MTLMAFVTCLVIKFHYFIIHDGCESNHNAYYNVQDKRSDMNNACLDKLLLNCFNSMRILNSWLVFIVHF